MFCAIVCVLYLCTAVRRIIKTSRLNEMWKKIKKESPLKQQERTQAKGKQKYTRALIWKPP